MRCPAVQSNGKTGVTVEEFCELFKATIIRKDIKEKTMDSIAGKIKQKKVNNYAWGDKVAFLVNGQWISALVSKSNPETDTTRLLRELQEGEEAEFSIVETSKDGKTYKNITDVIRITRDVAPPNEEPVQPSGKPGDIQGDTRVRSMALAYAKDFTIAMLGKDLPTETLVVEAIIQGKSSGFMIDFAKRFEQYILTGE
jgi:hypothetical protein